MGKQYKKLIKRRRRTAYLARKKAAINAEKPDSSKKVKSPAKKAVRKKATPAPKAEPVLKKQKLRMSLALMQPQKKPKILRHPKNQRSSTT